MLASTSRIRALLAACTPAAFTTHPRWPAARCLMPAFLAALALLLAACTTTPSAQPPAGTATPGVVAAVQTAVPPDVITGPIDGAVYVYVPAGEFLMGSADSDRDRAATGFEEPQHTVYLDAYYIGQTEVTNAQYALCVQAGVCQAPMYGSSTRGVYYGTVRYASYPVINVSWGDAQMYCTWTGGRLPTDNRGRPGPVPGASRNLRTGSILRWFRGSELGLIQRKLTQ